jgi:Uma2 family endonuclease
MRWERSVMATTTQDEALSGYVGHPPLVVHLQPVVNLTDDQLYEFSQLNRDLRIERNARGELIIMPPTGGETSERNAEITMQLRLWAKRDGGGATFDSSGGFRLPNGAVRSPDAAWVKRSRLETLGAADRKRFIPLCPDFVIELRSPTDSLSLMQSKMQEYLDSGAHLAWLIDPELRRVDVYRTGEPVEELENPQTLSAAPLLHGFELDLREIW